MTPDLVMGCNSHGGGTMTVPKAISLLLFLVALSGCASQLQQANTSQTIAEKEGEQQQQKSQMPTITYRPGG
jgi:hypothetical protein